MVCFLFNFFLPLSSSVGNNIMMATKTPNLQIPCPPTQGSSTRKSIKPRHRLCPIGLWIAQYSFHCHSFAFHGLGYYRQKYGKYRVQYYTRSTDKEEQDAAVRYCITASSLLLNHKSLRCRTHSSCCSTPIILPVSKLERVLTFCPS